MSLSVSWNEALTGLSERAAVERVFTAASRIHAQTGGRGHSRVTCAEVRRSTESCAVVPHFTEIRQTDNKQQTFASLAHGCVTSRHVMLLLTSFNAAQNSQVSVSWTNTSQKVFRSLGPFHGATAVPSVTRCRCRCRGHRCAGGARQYR